MNIWFDISNELSKVVYEIATKDDAFGDDFDPLVRIADPRFGDLQVNGILPYAKKNKCNPRELGTKLLELIQNSNAIDNDLLSYELAGPGFINFAFTAKFRFEWLKQYHNKSIFAESASEICNGRNVVIDFSSPNTAKQMHVGHIRSTVIGESVSRLLEYCGAKVIRDNHIGDWGTQFGILIHGIKERGFDLSADHQDPIAELEKIYKETTALAKDDEAVMSAARAELVKLQDNDPENSKLWESINEVSCKAFDEAYAKLDVKFDYVYGESYYRDKVSRVYDELSDSKLAEESEGALVVFHPEHPRFSEQPFIIRKSDGASNYATTDLATVLFRTEEFNAEEIVYLTDARQGDHFEQLFLTVEKWFKAKSYKQPSLKHITFGTILGEDGKAIKTRSGEPVKLRDLLDESVKRAYDIVSEKNDDLPEEEKKQIAEIVGISALRYADLMQNRNTNYMFSWDKMLSFEGNTAPYLLYAGARIHSIFRKLDIKPGYSEEQAEDLETDAEIQLARKIMTFPQTIKLALDDLCPHHICTYLFELAGEFSSFYNADKVITDDDKVKSRRLMLCARTLDVLETGLNILGIRPLERM